MKLVKMEKENKYFEIIDITEEGYGIAKKDNVVYFIKNAYLGEIVSIKNIEKKKNYYIAEKDSVIKKSDYEIISKCKYSDICQNCVFQNINYSKELEYKKNKVINNLNRIAKLNVKTNDVKIVSFNEYNYRNKITLKVKNGKIGFFERKSNFFIHIKNCNIVKQKINEYMSILNKYHLKYINEIVIKTNNNNIQIIFSVSEKEKATKVISNILKEKAADSVYIKYLKNKKYVTELFFEKEEFKIKIDQYTFIVSPESFFQVNIQVAQNIYNDIYNIYKTNNNNDVLLDLYSGVGISSVYLSDCFKKIISVEIVEKAVENAKINAKINNKKNITCISDKVENVINKLEIPKNTSVFIDPPRSGMDKKIIDTLSKQNIENIIYLSCNSSTLARDILYFKKYGYNVKYISIYDMFPRTLHVETLCVLSKK